MENVLGFLTNNSNLFIGGGVTGLIAWVLKKVPNEQIANIVETFFYGIGKTITLGLSKWSVSKKYWNQIVEPWFVDLVDNVFGGAVRGFIKGLRIDN
tara:strand:- start:61 stop:351 length:291 start_codon:yes stop_codon:yes gene_type:complete